ncbi:bifunctional GNAT family N-acetyltransferase/acetate--CoA ligase family protein [Aeromicrobium sp. 9AM]|uniref:bifunctional acetate--CoA ligase family protein/GNAT family N-acetyltransferase n=1 Tax=Aeromicrobium sp. 9AM TaxID=2653126 RepID=UPI0012F0CF47|nr:bifunctional GNAT family N-acetyltransferase/acetate--CoA ligase family protein [Aeromicrobium sp. 9AM]VXB98283.1 CoA-binding protein [Aeromicrobium sp. 9AM]
MTSEVSPVEHWEADVLLKDGRVAQLRPILEADAERLVEFYSRVSEQSKYFRFFAPYPTLSDKDVTRFTTVDNDRRVAFVVTLHATIIGVGRYDAVGDDEAEVAFLVEDAHQGRGVGQLLLEHLAQAGRERGIRTFVADVLPSNSRMQQIFREMGYQVDGMVDGGVTRLTFQIEPTDLAVGVMRAREQRAEAASIERIFRARSIAVIGASRRQDSIGQAMVRNLVLGDFSGSVYAVNSQAEAVSGLPAYKTVQDIPGEVDVAIVAVPADSVSDVVLDCAAKGVHGLVVISAGFAEEGPEGRQRQRTLLGLSRSYGLRLIGPNCLGFINTAPDLQLNASLSPSMPPQGRVGFFCQSGALGTAILESVSRRGLGLSTFVSAGNRADVSGNDLLQYWQEDDSTEVILLYLESIGNPRKFSRIARRVSRTKPIVAVKSGRSTQGVPVGHTVKRTSAPQSAVDAMFRQAGVIQVDTLDEMFDVAQLLAHQPLPRGNRISIVGNSDAVALIVADAASAAGLQVTDPVSLGADANADDFEAAIEHAIASPDTDALVAVYVPPLNTSGEEVANVLAAVGEQSDKPIVSTFLGSEGVPVLLRVPDLLGGSAGRGSVPSYAAPESAVRALARVVNYAEWAAKDHGDFHIALDHRTGDARTLVRQVLSAAPRGAILSTDQVHALLACYGIDLWTWINVHSRDEAIAAGEKLGWDVVLKAGSEHLRTRPDLAHVWRNIRSADEMGEAWDELTTWKGMRKDTKFFVQRAAADGIPVSFSVTEDPLFGPLVSFGLAGAPSELLGDRSYGIPPLTDLDAEAMIRDLRSAPLLYGYRGSDTVDVDVLQDIIVRLAAMKDDLPEIAELDLEPVLVHGKGYTALSARAKVVPSADRRGEWYVRRLSQPASMGDTLA